MMWRLVVTGLLAAVAAMCGAVYWPAATLTLGHAAGAQMLPSDAAYVGFSAIAGASALLTELGGLLFVGILAALWVPFLVRVARGAPVALLVAAGLAALLPAESRAYFEQKDVTEAYTILPNESAFWIPDVGDNKSSQASLDSEDYLKSNKLAVKRFIIPHAKLTNTGGFLGWDYYVPTGRLIIVDRTPYSHEWVDATDRGTSAKKEGFPCQSREGINITAGVSIATTVTEADAPRFLYNFGVTPPKGNRNDPVVIFTSVYYGRSLYEVMGDVGRKRVQTLVCNEIGKRSFDEANRDMVPMMDQIAKNAGDYFKSVGITMSFIGWGDTFSFDKEIQHAVNSSYVTKTDVANVTLMAQYAGVFQQLAAAHALRSFGEKTDGRFPTTVVGSVPSVESLMGSFLVPTAPAPKTAAPSTK